MATFFLLLPLARATERREVLQAYLKLEKDQRNFVANSHAMKRNAKATAINLRQAAQSAH